MRARHRHLNFRDCGAAVCLDARDIKQSEGSRVTSWTDRTRNANNVSSVVPPFNDGLYTNTGVSSLPSFQFTETSSNSTTFSFASAPLTGGSGPAVVTACNLQTNTSSLMVAFGTSGSNDHDRFSDGNTYHGFASNSRRTVGAVLNTNTDYILSMRSASNWVYYRDGLAVYTDASNTIGIGSSPLLQGTLGRMASFALFRSITLELLKRVHHAVAYSSKIRCA
jgi:hypothetical protein